jgi:hypothetical protein
MGKVMTAAPGTDASPPQAARSSTPPKMEALWLDNRGTLQADE